MPPENRSMEQLSEVAEAAYRRTDDEGSAVGAYNHGVILENRGDVDAAKAAYERAVERGHPGAATSLGRLLEASGDVEAAEAAYRRAAEKGQAAGAHRLAALLETRGEADEAREVRAAAGDLPPTAEALAAAAQAERRRVRIWQLACAVAVLIGVFSVLTGNLGGAGFVAILLLCGLAGLAVSAPMRRTVATYPFLPGIACTYLLWVWDFEPVFAVVFGGLVTGGIWWGARELRRRREAMIG